MNQNQEKSSLRDLIESVPDRPKGIDCTGLSGTAAAYLMSRLFAEQGLPMLLMVPSPKAAEAMLDNLLFFLPDFESRLLYFPAYNILPYKFVSYHNETAAKRIGTLYRLMADDRPFIVITPVDALLQKIIPRQEIGNYAELIMTGEECERDHLTEKLLAGGYTRTAIVEEPGDFCVRGGIVDIFSPLYPDPVRIEFFGDTVDAIRLFSAASQRKITNISEAVILPAKEAIINKHELVDVISRVRRQAAYLEIQVRQVRQLIDRIKNEGVFPGVESLTPLIYPRLDTIFDYTADKTLFIQLDSEALEKAAADVQARIQGNYNQARQEGRLCVEPERVYLDWKQARQIIKDAKPLRLRMFSVLKHGQTQGESLRQFGFSLQDNTGIRSALKRARPQDNLFSPLVEWINDRKRSGCTIYIVCRSKIRAQRVQSMLVPYGIQLRMMARMSRAETNPGDVMVVIGRASEGFVWPDQALAVITDEEIFGARYRRQLKPKPAAPAELIAVEDLKGGDFVVHVEHGIGRYEGLVKLQLNGTTNDFLLIVYRDDDKLYLPVDRMNMVQKYMGVDGVAPVTDKMGGKSWSRIKARVKKSAEKIAGELLKLYAARRLNKGFAFDHLDEELDEFEAGFAYEETADQKKAIDDVLQDMARPTPMDRLVCGDVGYGKTEVALRASFVAVYNGKQVAVLVPTTVLAEQHFATFSERFKRFPLRIACLSRFRLQREQRSIVRELKEGKIDIVIGTHRLLSKDVAFKDLGLLVLDEEQRFGVKHKEKLKALRKAVDVLTLTATPIPRTLHMSLMGIRDISVISTPPEYRQSIITYISEFDDAVVAEAIRKERMRDGQVFFIHNNIESIEKTARHLKQLTPEVRLDIAHGRLEEDQLEQVMLRFLNKETDMLVCTTIVESGLDIPSANTILVNRADKFGLAQMYQLRGRVGRSEEQAYAYLFIPHESFLGRDAQKRLKVLMEHSDLGSGFQIAMSDLQIRGGGTILGASQSGHIAAVGYEMFLKLMENAVAELKGEPVRDPLSPEINIRLSTYIPEAYIPDIDQRLSAYRRLARMTELSEITEFKAECIDRYGVMPEEVANLLLKIILKVLSIKAGVKRLDLTGSNLALAFSTAHQQNPSAMVDMIVSEPRKYSLTPEYVLKVKLSAIENTGLLAQVKNILKEIAQHVNNLTFKP
jgi:transcription-repair coupling factor (superfamily II helicase)